jgi:transposase InsO family protein
LKQKRKSSATVTQKNEELLTAIKEIKAEHPFWGYRRVCANLRYRNGFVVNQKHVYRLMKIHHLLVAPNLKLIAKRTSNTRKPCPTKPNEWWGIDMTKVLLSNVGWLYVVFVLDWHTKKIVGHYAGIQSKTEHWLEALNKGLNQQFIDGVRDHELHLMSDNGNQPTSTSFMKSCATCGIKQAFTSYNNPKGNADTERLMRTFKEEFAWLSEWTSVAKFTEDLDDWVKYYNTEYLHSALRYQTPIEFEQKRLREITLIAA